MEIMPQDGLQMKTLHTSQEKMCDLLPHNVHSASVDAIISPRPVMLEFDLQPVSCTIIVCYVEGSFVLNNTTLELCHDAFSKRGEEEEQATHIGQILQHKYGTGIREVYDKDRFKKKTRENVNGFMPDIAEVTLACCVPISAAQLCTGIILFPIYDSPPYYGQVDDP